jgi:uncharacterized protein (DUF983 family)
MIKKEEEGNSFGTCPECGGKMICADVADICEECDYHYGYQQSN